MRNPAPWQRRYENIALLSLLFGILSQYLFVGNGFHVSVPVFTALFYCLYFYAVRGRIGGFDQWRGQTKSGWLLAVPVVMIAATFAIYANALFRGLNFFLLPALVAAQTVLLARGSSKPWYRNGFYGDVLYLCLIQPFAYLTVPFGLLAERIFPKPGYATSETAGRIRRIIIGIVLAAPLLCLVIGLLASADRIFNELVSRIPRLLFQGEAVDWFVRIFVGVVIALYAFCYLWSLLFLKSDNQNAMPKQSSRNQAWPGRLEGTKRRSLAFDPLTASALLIRFNVVYLVFAAIQFSYLFGAARGLLPEGADYAESARQGFAQLIVVAIINLILLLAGLHLVKRGERAGELTRRIALSLLVGCTVIMLVSAFGRLSLYEEAYGFTQSRLLVHGFMIFLGVLLAISLFRIWREHFSLAKAYIGLAIAAYLMMNYANLDALIAERNSERFEHDGRIDTAYLATLSADALPSLLRLQARHKNEISGLDAAINDIRQRSQGGDGWPGWNWSKARAGARGKE